MEKWNVGIVTAVSQQTRFHSTIIPVFHRSGLHLSGVGFQVSDKKLRRTNRRSRTRNANRHGESLKLGNPKEEKNK
jgi:hypothetical protein